MAVKYWSKLQIVPVVKKILLILPEMRLDKKMEAAL